MISASHSGLICAFDITKEDSKNSYPIRWSQRISCRIEADPNVSTDGSLIYIADYSGYIRAFETLSGRLCWLYRTNDQIKCSPITINFKELNFILCGSFDHYLYCWQQYSGHVVWRLNVNNSAIFSSPAIWYSNSNQPLVIVCTLNGTIACCRIDNGQIVWKNSYSNKPIFSTPKIYQDLLIVGIIDTRIIAISVFIFFSLIFNSFINLI